ncbi:AraC family transcriptional regulator [Lachnospiraceae bacterium 54-53]
MHNAYQSFGFLDLEKQLKAPLFLCEFGIELRSGENYDFHNQTRGPYSGFLLQYTLEGCGAFETPEKTVPLPSGWAFFITFPDDSRYYLPENGYWKFFYIHFDGELAPFFFHRIRSAGGGTFPLEQDSQTIRCFLEEYHAVKSGGKYQRYESGVFLYRFLSSLLRELETPPPQNNNAFVEDAAAWMGKNYASQAGLSEMCRSLGVSLPHLTRQFHSQKGITPMKYLTQLRLEQAISFLLNTTMNIDRIAAECGFANGNYFAKVFRKAMGMPPTEYRKVHTGRITGANQSAHIHGMPPEPL